MIAGRRSIDWLALGAALLTIILWASAFVGIRAAGQDFSPGALALGRLVIGTAVLGTFCLARRGPLPHGREWALVIGAGVIWFGIYNLVLNSAEQVVDAGTAAMLVNVGPLFIIVLAGHFLHEGFPPRLIAGSAVAFGGAVVIGLATAESTIAPDAGIGIALCLVAAMAYACGVTLEKPVVARVPALTVTALACAVGAVITLPFFPALLDQLNSASPDSVAWMVYLGAAPTAVAFTGWTFVLSRMSAGQTGAMSYLIPPTAVVLAGLILGEVPPLLAIAGGVISIAGVMIGRSRGARGRT